MVQIYPGHILGNVWLTTCYGSVGNLEKAIEHAEFVVQNERTAEAVGVLGQLYMAKGLYRKAEDICGLFLKDVEDNAFVRFMLGCSYLFRRQFDLAGSEQEKAYLLNPTLSFMQGWRGIFLFCKDDFAGAEKILDVDWQATLLVAQGNFNEAISLSRQNLEKSKGDKGREGDAYRGLAGALESAGRYEDAYWAFEQHLSVSAEYRKSTGESGLPYLPTQKKWDLFGKGVFQAEMRSFDEAKKTAEELKSLIEKGINAKELRLYEYLIGQIELGKKNYRRAADFFSRACGRLDFESYGVPGWSDFAIFFDAMARALYGSGDLDKALQEYEKITLLTIGRLYYGEIYARAYYMLGKIAELQGDKARARQNYTKFLDLWKEADPGLPEVEDARKRLALIQPS